MIFRLSRSPLAEGSIWREKTSLMQDGPGEVSRFRGYYIEGALCHFLDEASIKSYLIFTSSASFRGVDC